MKFDGTIQFLEYWHSGSGTAGMGDVDDTPVRDHHGLPYLPGKSLKGLLHEAFCELAAWNSVPADIRPDKEIIQRLFGNESNQGRENGGQFRFFNAVVPDSLSAHIRERGMQDGLYEILSATAIDKDGVAHARSLRRVEVAVPLSLDFSIEFHESPENPAPANLSPMMHAACSLIRRAGKFRTNGCGRCRVSISGQIEQAAHLPKP